VQGRKLPDQWGRPNTLVAGFG